MSDKKITEYRSAKSGGLVIKQLAWHHKSMGAKERNSAVRPDDR